MLSVLKCTLFGLMLLLPGLLPAQSTTRFVRSSFDKIIITETDFPSPETFSEGQLKPGIVLSQRFVNAPDNPKRATLPAAESNALFRKLIDKKSYRYGASICFIPRLDILFLNGDTLINHVAVCIECNRLRSSVRIPAADWSEDGLNPKGLTPAFRQYLSKLIARYGFVHVANGSSLWDHQ